MDQRLKDNNDRVENKVLLNFIIVDIHCLYITL